MTELFQVATAAFTASKVVPRSSAATSEATRRGTGYRPRHQRSGPNRFFDFGLSLE